MGGSILVSSSGTRSVPAQVVEFASGTTGGVAPSRTVGGPDLSRMETASGIARDAKGFLFVAAPVVRSVNVYPPGASGDIAPFATLAGRNPGLTNPQGIAIHEGMLYVANGPFGPGAVGMPSVALFKLPLAAGTNNVDPVAVIAGPATGLDSPFGLAVDPAGNVYIANLNNTVTVYSPPAPSSYATPHNAAPILTISSGLVGPEGLAIRRDTLFVACDNDTVAAFSLPTCTPGAVIAGPHTRLDQPLGIDVDSSGNIFVVNTADEVLKFAPGASGDAPPIAVISGPSTGLNTPQFVFAGP